MEGVGGVVHSFIDCFPARHAVCREAVFELVSVCVLSTSTKTLLNATVCSAFIGPACTTDAKGATVSIFRHETSDEMNSCLMLPLNWISSKAKRLLRLLLPALVYLEEPKSSWRIHLCPQRNPCSVAIRSGTAELIKAWDHKQSMLFSIKNMEQDWNKNIRPC